MIGVSLKESETVEIALRRFKRECINAGLQAEIKKHEFYEKPSTKRKRQKESALRKRERKRIVVYKNK